MKARLMHMAPFTDAGIVKKIFTMENGAEIELIDTNSNVNWANHPCKRNQQDQN